DDRQTPGTTNRSNADFFPSGSECGKDTRPVCLPHHATMCRPSRPPLRVNQAAQIPWCKVDRSPDRHSFESMAFHRFQTLRSIVESDNDRHPFLQAIREWRHLVVDVATSRWPRLSAIPDVAACLQVARATKGKATSGSARSYPATAN